MNSEPSAIRVWRWTTFFGALLIVLGTSAFYIDIAAHFRFDFIEHHYDAFGVSILIGIIFAFIGCIGWARFRNKKGRASMAAAVFLTPWALFALGSPIEAGNVHGPSMIPLMLNIPAVVLAGILLLMAEFGRQTQQ